MRVRRFALVTFLFAGSSGAIVATVPTAMAAGDGCVATSALVTTCTYSDVGEHAIAVPAFTTRVAVTLIGAHGGNGRGTSGGRGAKVTGTLAPSDLTRVVSASTIYAEVGGIGGFDTNLVDDGPGGGNGGGKAVGPRGSFAPGAGGGGASDVRLLPASDASTLNSRLAIAAGGGGAVTQAGDGGAAGAPGSTQIGGGVVGQPGTAADGGNAGTDRAGSLGQGGIGTRNGGGGGGGLYGGGGGDGGGGGGGSSLVPSGGQFDTVDDTATVIVEFTAATVAPAITTQPNDATVNADSKATFTAAATGNPTPSVQWQRSIDDGDSFTDIAGATDTTYTTPATTPADDGNRYRAVFSNSAGDTNTNAATLTVHYAPAFSTDSDLPPGTVGERYTTTIKDTGNPAPTDSVTAGSLPPGLTLAGDPVLSGTPTKAGTFTFTITASNSVGSQKRTFHVVIATAPSASASESSSGSGSSGTPPTAAGGNSPAADSSGELSSTGVNVLAGTAASLALLIGGILALLFSRRRRLH